MARMSSKLTLSLENSPPCTTNTRLFSTCARGSQQKASLKSPAMVRLYLALTCKGTRQYSDCCQNLAARWLAGWLAGWGGGGISTVAQKLQIWARGASRRPP